MRQVSIADGMGPEHRYDRVAVDRLIAGRIKAADAEPCDVVEAVRQLHEKGLGYTSIATALGMDGTPVSRILRDLETGRRPNWMKMPCR